MEKQFHPIRTMLLMILVGVIINYLGVKIALFFSWPIFLDSVGTILIAALGGYLPGISVGFLSNLINGVSDPITLYYGIIIILIAMCAAFAAEHRMFAKIWTSMMMILFFAFIGGFLGSLLSWMLYGFSIGTGISAPYAVFLYEKMGMGEFSAQLLADVIIDVLDKTITVAICMAIWYILPARLLKKLPWGGLFIRQGKGGKSVQNTHQKYRRHSLKNKMVWLIVCSVMLLGVLSTAIGYIIFRNALDDKFIEMANGTVDLAESVIDENKINSYLTQGEDASYLETKGLLEKIRTNLSDVSYLYVYQIHEDGCHVVFDLDTPDVKGDALGMLIPFDTAFLPYINDLLEGKEIPAIISNDTYGWLLTVYHPLFDQNGNCVAYVAVDVPMDDVIAERAIFIIKMLSLTVGVTILIIFITIWYADTKMVRPINGMAFAANAFAYDTGEDRVFGSEKMKALQISTGDEIENLYHALTKTVDDVAAYIKNVKEKAAIINQMQNNVIYSFASMVESRDMNTGTHIKHTAYYVGSIASEMRKEGMYPSLLTEEYIRSLIRSAPLHDIGKIKIPDSLLN